MSLGRLKELLNLLAGNGLHLQGPDLHVDLWSRWRGLKAVERGSGNLLSLLQQVIWRGSAIQELQAQQGERRSLLGWEERAV